MRFALTSEHRDFFQRNGFIEFEGIFSEEQLTHLQQLSEQVIQTRLSTPRIEKTPTPTLYREGYDLSRESLNLQRTLYKRPLCEIASELFQTKPLQLGFEQYFAITTHSEPPLQLYASLSDLSCVKPLAGGLFILFSDPLAPEASLPLPSKLGNILLFSPTLMIAWSAIFKQVGLRLLLIAFAEEKSLYRDELRDPQRHHLKKLGYVFGDRLKDSLHPILLR